MPKYFVIGCVFTFTRESGNCEVEKNTGLKDGSKNDIHTPVKLFYELEFRHHMSQVQNCGEHPEAINVTKKDVCIFIFYSLLNEHLYLCLLAYTHLLASQWRSGIFSLPMKLSLCPSAISSISLFSQRPLPCICCYQQLYLLFCDIYLYF